MAKGEKPRKLTVGTMVRFAYRSVFGRLELIPELGWIVLLALLAVSIVPDLLIPGRHLGEQFRLDPLDFAHAAVALLALSAFAVRWHQSILVGDPRRQPPALFFHGWARFLIYGCAVYAMLGAIVAVAVLMLGWSTPNQAVQGLLLLVAAAACWLALLATVRCALVFPAAACGKPIGIGESWHLMRGNVWRLIGASILATLPVKLAAFGLMALLVATALPGGNSEVAPPLGVVILAGVIEAISDMLLAALGASLLSGFYRELVAWRGNGAGAQAA